jgi:sugar-specific transcriptional regulator TrmB
MLAPVVLPWKTVVQKLHTCYNYFMITDTTAVRTYFAKLGLETEIADLYLALHAHGPQTISELSRNSRVERTRIYRLIDKLMQANLIEVESHYKRGVIKAAPIANLHILINEKGNELKSLQDELGLIEQVLARNSLSSPATRVQFYQGPEGIRQVRWNQLRAKKPDSIGYAHQIYDTMSGNAFMHRWAEEFERRGLRKRLLVDDQFFQSWKKRKPQGRRIKGYEYNYIDPKIFKIGDNCDVYDDVIVYFQYKNGEMFAIEIYNQDIADTQRQMFEMLWLQSKPETRF